MRRGPAPEAAVPGRSITPVAAFLVGIIAAWSLIFVSSAGAFGQGTVSGVVTDGDGGVVGANVVLIGASNNEISTTTGPGGAFSVAAWPDTYRVGAYPPADSADGFASVSNVQVHEGATTTANLSLGPAASAVVSGNAFYPDHAPDAGIQVMVTEDRHSSGTFPAYRATTDEDGNWSVGALPGAFYKIYYSAPQVGTSIQYPEYHAVGNELLALEGVGVNLSRELSGARPGGTLEGTVMAAEGWPGRGARLEATQVGGGPSGTISMDEGHFKVSGLPAGTYQLSATGGDDEDDTTGSATVTVSDGRISQSSVQLGARSTPPGIAASHEQEDLGWLNAQRARWGIPAGLTAVPLWSQACAAHDAYMAQNKLLEHSESPYPGHSETGEWAGEHAVLTSAGQAWWSPTANPWMDAPYHLEQLFAPRLLDVGIDGSAYGCVTTWPGMRRPPAPAGTVYTFPGNGTTGLPPVENAEELPHTPNEDLGISHLTGRQLIVWEEDGESYFIGETHITGASLSSPSGPVEVRWIDGNISSIIIPIQPLAPFTTYTATVSLAATHPFAGNVASVGPETYSWSFTTGKNNPGGSWDEDEIVETPRFSRGMKARATWAHGHLLVKGSGFAAGAVAVQTTSKSRAKGKGKKTHKAMRTLARATAADSGTFIARFRWPRKKPLTMLVVQGKSRIAVSYVPKVHRRNHAGKRHRRHRPKQKP